MKSIIKISKRGIIAILTLCILLGNAGTCVNVAAMAAETTATVEETTATTEAMVPELMPMMARSCGYTSVSQMQQMILKGQAPSGVKSAHNGFQGQQPHIHFTDGTAMNYDGTPHHGTPSPTNDIMRWLNSNGWCL